MAWMKIPHTSVTLSLARICQPRITYDYRTRRGLAESSTNHYDVLGLKPTASASQIKSAYYQLSKKYHPDVAVSVDDAKEKFARLSSAYEVLSNPNKRALYDRTLHPSVGRATAHTPGSNTDTEYRDFLRRRGSFHARPGGQPSPGASDRMRYNYEDLLRQQFYRRQNWEGRKNFGHRLQQRQAANMHTAMFFLLLALAMSLHGSVSDWYSSKQRRAFSIVVSMPAP